MCMHVHILHTFDSNDTAHMYIPDTTSMHAKEIILIIFVILLILISVRAYAGPYENMYSHAFTKETYPPNITSNDSLGIDPVTQHNTQANKYVPAVETRPVTARTRKNVSFAPQKEVARYSKQDGNIQDITHARV